MKFKIQSLYTCIWRLPSTCWPRDFSHIGPRLLLARYILTSPSADPVLASGTSGIMGRAPTSSHSFSSGWQSQQNQQRSLLDTDCQLHRGLRTCISSSFWEVMIISEAPSASLARSSLSQLHCSTQWQINANQPGSSGNPQLHNVTKSSQLKVTPRTVFKCLVWWL